ncbi:MAG: 30S ribosomal protein S6 [Saprospirales bacterium]|mgnify:FL=1|nr:30S ribosomal protein S6 [Saprospirales bacterium]|tara:strand:- start:106 stop:468 length:363 start_codon:yes stop_codon:yes gene_type:complete
MKNYETTFIITPVLSEKEVQETVNTYKKFIESNGGKIISEEAWGLKQLAYAIEKKTTGVYHHFEFQSNGDLIDTLELAFRRDENILRFLTIALDRYGVEYNEKKRNKQSTPEVVSEEQEN